VKTEREAFDFLMSLDPVFNLRFADDNAFAVQVVEPYDIDQLTLIDVEPA